LGLRVQRYGFILNLQIKSCFFSPESHFFAKTSANDKEMRLYP